MTRGIIRGAPRAELKASVLAALNPDLLTLAEVTEEAAAELCGEPGRIWRTRLRAALVTWGRPSEYQVGEWIRPHGPWQLDRWLPGDLYVMPGDRSRDGQFGRLVVRVEDLEPDMTTVCLLNMPIDVPLEIWSSIWIGPAQ